MRTLSVYYSQKDAQGEVREEVKKLTENLGLVYIEVCVDGDQQLEERYQQMTPVVLVGPYRIHAPFTLPEVEVAIKATLYQDSGQEDPQLEKRRFTFSLQERVTLWFTRFYPWFISVVILLFVGLSFLPPVLMKSGAEAAANGFYKFYNVFCHQLAYRSYFLFGIQPIYPRELAHLPDLVTYEDASGMAAENIAFARNFKGNERLGYKTALCQRDIAIYGSLGLFGIIFALTGKRIKVLPWYIWIIVAIVPIGLDGISQLPGLTQGWPSGLPIRESTPLLRTITGMLFGLGTGWFMYPLMEESIKEARFALQRKQTVVKQISAK
jgi:uncharacterized membrane protein